MYSRQITTTNPNQFRGGTSFRSSIKYLICLIIRMEVGVSHTQLWHQLIQLIQRSFSLIQSR